MRDVGRGDLVGRNGAHVLLCETGRSRPESEEAPRYGDSVHYGGGDEDCPAADAAGQGGRTQKTGIAHQKVPFFCKSMLLFENRVFNSAVMFRRFELLKIHLQIFKFLAMLWHF